MSEVSKSNAAQEGVNPILGRPLTPAEQVPVQNLETRVFTRDELGDQFEAWRQSKKLVVGAPALSSRDAALIKTALTQRAANGVEPIKLPALAQQLIDAFALVDAAGLRSPGPAGDGSEA